jgi:hypothetical protein
MQACQQNNKFWEELIAYFPFTTYYLIRHGPRKNTAFNSSSIVECVSVAAGTCLPSGCLPTIEESHRQHNDLTSLLLFFQNKESRQKLLDAIIFCTCGTEDVCIREVPGSGLCGVVGYRG